MIYLHLWKRKISLVTKVGKIQYYHLLSTAMFSLWASSLKVINQMQSQILKIRW